MKSDFCSRLAPLETGKRQTLRRNQKRPSSERRRETAIKGTQTEKAETTSPSFTEDTLVCVQNARASIFWTPSGKWLARPTHKSQPYFMYKQWTARNCVFFFFLNAIYNSSSKRETFRYKSNKAHTGSECWQWQTTDERNQRRAPPTGKHSLLMGWKTRGNYTNSPPKQAVDLTPFQSQSQQGSLYSYTQGIL